jgi:hypothetical protein
MIQQIAKCPYCETVIAADLVNSKFVFNPESRRPVCAHIAYIDGHITYWSDDFTQVDCKMGLIYESSEVLKLCDEFDLREYMSKLRNNDNAHPQAEYVTDQFGRDSRADSTDIKRNQGKDLVDFNAWLVFTKDAGSFYRACQDDWKSRQGSGS